MGNCPMGHKVCQPNCHYKEVCEEAKQSDPVERHKKEKDARKTNLL